MTTTTALHGFEAWLINRVDLRKQRIRRRLVIALYATRIGVLVGWLAFDLFRATPSPAITNSFGWIAVPLVLLCELGTLAVRRFLGRERMTGPERTSVRSQ